MNGPVASIAARLGLRAPQRRALEILDRIVALTPLRKDTDAGAALAAIRSAYPDVADFERAFPSVCFALATGVGKTRLMGAFISYLHLGHGVKNFFVLAPNLTIYNKLIGDFTPGGVKYVFRGIAEFAAAPPVIVTGETWDRPLGDPFPVRINIFNIAKINIEIRDGRRQRIRGFREEIGESYFDWLAGLDDLVLVMDESHRYRGSAGTRAINDLKPVLGLELTATPFVESPRGPVPFRNVVYSYPLARALEDGFVKTPAVVTRRDFEPARVSAEALERLKLEDGVGLHETVKASLDLYARETGRKRVKPFVLIVARDTAHAAALMTWIRSEAFFGGRYEAKVIQVDSSRTGPAEDEMIERLLRVEDVNEPTEIVIHVNMLKEGWDVTNLYTIIPLRAANARTLIEQSIGRGLRLPYGVRTGVTAVDRLNIVAHDRFREIVDETSRADSPIRLQALELDPGSLAERTVTVVSEPRLATALRLSATDPQDVEAVLEVIRQYETQPETLPDLRYLHDPAVQASILRDAEHGYRAGRATDPPPDLGEVVRRVAGLVAEHSISIPQFARIPAGTRRSGFRLFTLDLAPFNYQPPSEELWLEHLRTLKREVVRLGVPEPRGASDPEDDLVSGLIDFDDVAYEEQADLLYDLAHQVVDHLRTRMSPEAAGRIIRFHRKEIASLVHRQMLAHVWQDDDAAFDMVVTRGFTGLRPSAFAAPAGEAPLDFRTSPPDKAGIARRLFGGFDRCLYPVQKFHSDPERLLAVILDREALKWFRPAKGQFRITYRCEGEESEYQPDFVAEIADRILMIEVKAANQMGDGVVLAKRGAAVAWCGHATGHALRHGAKPWTYVLAPHDAVASNMTLGGLVQRFAVRAATAAP